MTAYGVSVRQLQHLVQVRDRSDPVWDCMGDSPDGLFSCKTKKYDLKTPLMNHKSHLCVVCIHAGNEIIVAPRGCWGKNTHHTCGSQ